MGRTPPPWHRRLSPKPPPSPNRPPRAPPCSSKSSTASSSRQSQTPRWQGSAKAIEKGEATCEGKTPIEIREAFIAEADLSEDQQEAVSELPRFEANPSPSFPAGQVAALVYQRSLPGEILPSYGFQGCVYALSLGLKAELAPKAGAKTKEGK